MKIAFVTFFGYNVLCSAGFPAISTTELTEETYAVAEDDISANDSEEYFNRTETNVDLTHININDSEIFENGQSVKEDHERSLVYIKNAKSRLPWRTKTRESFFLDIFSNPNNLLRISTAQNSRGYNFMSQPVRNGYYKEKTLSELLPGYIKQNIQASINYPFSRFHNKNDRPYASYNVNTLPPVSAVINNYYKQKGFQFPVKIEPRKHIIANTQYDKPKANESISLPYQNLRNYNQYGVPITATVMIPVAMKESRKPIASKNDSVSSPVVPDVPLNCYNRECASRARSYRVLEYNGILRGLKCVCKPPTHPKNQVQDWRTRRQYTTSERRVRVNSSDESYEQLVKETKKLTRIVDGME